MAEPGTVWILSGIGGCEVYTPPIPLLGSRRIWLDYVAMLAGAWRILGLAPDGVSSWTPGVGVMVPGPALADYYGQLISWLVQDGWSVRCARLVLTRTSYWSSESCCWSRYPRIHDVRWCSVVISGFCLSFPQCSSHLPSGSSTTTRR